MTESRPWYREPMVWLIIAFPVTSILVGITLYVIADRTRDGLVVDDYYKKGKEINLSLARDQVAARLDLHGALQLDAAAQQVRVTLAGNRETALPARMMLRWLHATRDGFDRVQALEQVKPGTYQAVFPELAPGHWYVQLEAQDWRVQGSLRVPQDTRVELRPSPTAATPAK